MRKDLTSFYNNTLLPIAEKRTGGQIALDGFFFQIQYSLWLLLNILHQQKVESIRLEGIEDLDVFEYSAQGNIQQKLYQVKRSKNSMSPSQFWDKGILQNFLEVYVKKKDVEFFVVHDMELKGDFLREVIDGNVSQKAIDYWLKSIEKYQKTDKKEKIKGWDNKNITHFLNSISFQEVSTQQIEQETINSLVNSFGMNSGNVELFYKGLLQQVLMWSIDRTVVSFSMLQSVIKEIQSGVEKGSVNQAVQEGWIKEVDFGRGKESDGERFYEGLAARPSHIANGLPIRRKTWETTIKSTFEQSDITVIRASSGQGKSTLGWQTAFNLKEKGYTIYELSLCDIPEKVGALTAFFETRYKYLGESPVLVIDGLNHYHQVWDSLAKSLQNAPVKIIITSREEDWRLYGRNSSALDIRFVPIKMDFEEAKSIFKLLQKNNLIHNSTSHWQTAWESISEKGLLIEYIYLITQGQMLHTRLEEQVQILNDAKITTDGAAKIEILRLVSLADCCGIRLKTTDVISHVKKEIGFVTDRGMVIQQLEQEYYLKFGAKFIEGLHPIRSRHLVELLHQFVPAQETAIHLMPMISVNQITLFFSSIFSFLSPDDHSEFIHAVGKFYVSKSYLEMAAICDGLFTYEVTNHWLQNKEHYDEIFRKGGIGLAPIETVPWMEQKIISNLNEKTQGRLDYIIDGVAEITPFNLQSNLVIQFLKVLRENDIYKSEKSVLGLGNLSQWFLKFDLSINLFDNFEFNQIITLISEGQLVEATQLTDALDICQKENFSIFMKKNKSTIFSKLKKQTQSFTIQEAKKDLLIEYLLPENRVTKGNEESVDRIKIIKSILPFYDRYCTEGYTAPLEIYDTLQWKPSDESKKRMPAENIYDKFQIRLNQIWNESIQSFYQVESIYEWQKQWIDIRQTGLLLVKGLNRLIETYLEGKISKFDNLIPSINKTGNKLAAISQIEKSISQKRDNDFFQSIKDKESILKKWTLHLGLVNNQMRALFGQKDEQLHAVHINILTTCRDLEKMQNAFDSISTYPVKYFDTKELVESEKIYYQRFLNSAQYLRNNSNKIDKLQGSKRKISAWATAKERAAMQSIRDAIYEFEEKSYSIVIEPDFIQYDGLLTNITIGIIDWDIKNIERDFTFLLEGAAEFADVEFDFLTILIIQNKQATAGWRFSKKSIKQLKEIAGGVNAESVDFENPAPININAETIAPLKDVRLKPVQEQKTNSSIYHLIEILWQLSLYRQKIDKKSKIEMDWLETIETKYITAVNSFLLAIKQEGNEKKYQFYSDLSAEVIKGKRDFSDEDFKNHSSQLFKKIIEEQP